ncbi:MAG: molecular chaperone TorD family protein, partial [Acidobacteria bacterium]|nr:molecular chaperone TorD family protein [Acidobacteriota bacterium]
MEVMDRIAPWVAFAARGFLSAEPEELLALAAELRSSELSSPWSDVLSSMEAALRDDSGELEKEYVRLFLNPAGALLPPWQSAYGE